VGLGTVTLPAGLCARRVGEGDDLTTHVTDSNGVVRVRVTRLAHGAVVGDACASGATGVQPLVIADRPARACTKTDGRRCYALLAVANVCAAAIGDAALVDGLIAQLPSQ